jgi:hypothetical protein
MPATQKQNEERFTTEHTEHTEQELIQIEEQKSI